MQAVIAPRKLVQSAIAAGETLPLCPLALSMESCVSEENMNKNFFATLDRGYTPINDLLWKTRGAVSLVGAGPSIAKTYKELVGDVCAINSALAFLLDHGVVPRYAMIWDADPVCENFAVPHPEVTYLIGSRCHPSVFERLKDCRVIVWHAAGDHNIAEIMNRPEVIAKQTVHEPLINGGSAGITRGIYLVNALGYNEIHLFGADSCYSGDATHVNGSLVPEKDIMVSIGNDPPLWFRTTPEWCAQIEEYRAVYTVFTAYGGNTLHPHGEGMLPTMHELLEEKRRKLGREGFILNMMKQNEDAARLSGLAEAVAQDERKRKNLQPLEAGA